jgi:hypothetical protein
MVDERMLGAYTYLTPQTTIIRPQGMREVTAIRALRTGQYRKSRRPYSHDHERSHVNAALLESVIGNGNRDEHCSVEDEAREMLSRGFVRPEPNWRTFKADVHRHNKDVLLDWLSL